MSHVDDGTLHAYLDGELSPVEVERLDTHIAGCPVCRARLVEERALIDRAARLLGMAVPAGPERAAPPLHQLQRRASTWSRLRVPLAWAATVLVAVGLGYYAGFSGSPRVKDAAPAAAQPMIATTESASTGPASGLAGARASGVLATPTDDERGAAAQPMASNSQMADRIARTETDRPQQAQAAAEPGRRQDNRADALTSPSAAASSAPAQLPQDRASPTVREVAPAAPPSPAASGVISMAPSTTAVQGYRDRNSVRLTTSWPAIEAKGARDLLGTAPAAIPGFAIRSMRRNPGPVREVVVEQVIAGAVVTLFERPLIETRALEEQPIIVDGQAASQDTLAAKAVRRNERLARFVGNLRVEIAGPLPADSLSRLLDLVKQ